MSSRVSIFLLSSAPPKALSMASDVDIGHKKTTLAMAKNEIRDAVHILKAVRRLFIALALILTDEVFFGADKHAGSGQKNKQG